MVLWYPWRTPSAPNQSWAADTTFLRAGDGWLYLAVVLDLYSRFVVGWATSAVHDQQLVTRALEMAVRRRRPEAGLLHHSDQGTQYTGEAFQRVLVEYGIPCSMSRRGNCYDNAAMESWFSTLKSELGERFENHGAAKEQLFDYIEVFYNQQAGTRCWATSVPPSSRGQRASCSRRRDQPVHRTGSSPTTNHVA